MPDTQPDAIALLKADHRKVEDLFAKFEAAKGAENWRFPAAGLVSADGLVRALLNDAEADRWTLTLEAQGAVGLHVYAGREASLRLGAMRALRGRFAGDGVMRLVFAPEGLVAADLADMEIVLTDASR